MNEAENIAVNQRAAPGNIQAIWKILETIQDPEVPVLSIIDLGIVREVRQLKNHDATSDELYEITITPTYSGCPAMDMIRMQIQFTMAEHGYKNVRIKNVLSPAWTTDWMTEAGKEKLAAYGIAPPAYKINSCNSMEANDQVAIQCPHCKSYHTELISRFGSTACKALYKCNDCKEPFDYFKCH